MKTLHSILLYAMQALLIAIIAAFVVIAHDRYFRNQTKILVVDMSTLAAPIVNNETLTDNERMTKSQELGKKLKLQFDRMAQDGVLILDSSAVVRVPDQYLYTDKNNEK